MTAWLLPENVEDVLPPQAWRMEDMRRALLDLFRSRGYQLVVPPLMEYVDSLLTGVGADLDLKTFKLVDQLTGRLMGVRADITPQVARIDAHLLNRQGVARLCYAGSVLHTQPSGLMRTREPLQIGAELAVGSNDGEMSHAPVLAKSVWRRQAMAYCGSRVRPPPSPSPVAGRGNGGGIEKGDPRVLS